MLLFTSIPPRFSRKDASGNEIGQEYLAACVASWRDNGFEPVSINRPDEVDSVRALGLVDVRAASMREAVWPNRFGPPLGDVFDAMPDEQVAFTNADIYILRSDLAQVLKRHGSTDVITARRSDVDHLGAPRCDTFEKGFDFFSFKPATIAPVIRHPDIRRFQLGAPWWDYAFPMACTSCASLVGLREPVIVHQTHMDRWDVAIWKDLGLEAGRVMALLHPREFGPIMQNVSTYEHPQRVLSYKFRALLFENLSTIAVNTEPCRYFAKPPVTNTRLLKRYGGYLAKTATFKRLRGSNALPRRMAHGLRDLLRSARGKTGQPKP
jgi:hypothetical protein